MKTAFKNRKTIATALLIVVILTVTLVSYNVLRNRTIQQCWRNLKENAEAVDAQFSALVDSNTRALESMAMELSAQSVLKDGQTLLRISSARVGAMHSPVRLFLPDGYAILESGVRSNVSDIVRYEGILQNSVTLSNAHYDPFNPGIAVIEHYCPVVRGGETVAMLCAVVQLNGLSDYIHATVYNGEADILAFERGDKLFFYDTTHEDDFVMLNERKAVRGYSAEEWEQHLYDGIEDCLEFRSENGGSDLLYSIPSAANENWMISIQVDHDIAFEDTHILGNGFMVLLGTELLCMAMYIWFMLRVTKTDLHSFYEAARRTDREQSERSIEDLHTVLSAMTESYEALIQVDFRTGLEVRYRENDRMKSVGEKMDYLSRIRFYAEKFIIKEDREAFLEGMQPERLLAAVANGEPAVLRYRIYMEDGSIRWHETRAVRSPARSAKECVLVGLSDVDAEVKAADEHNRDLYNREMLKVIDTISEDFACVLLIDPETTLAQTYRMHPLYLAALPKWETLHAFYDQLDCIIENTVHPDDREAFRSATAPETVFLKLHEDPANPVYIVHYRHMENGITQRWALKFRLMDTLPVRVIAGFHNVDTEFRAAEAQEHLQNEHAQQRAFINLFVENYVSAYYLNLATGEYVTYKRTAALQEKYGGINNFYTSLEKYISEDVHPDDRARLRAQIRPEVIRHNLSGENVYQIVFRERTQALRYLRMKVIKAREEDHVAVGFVDATDEYLKEAQEKERLEGLVHERTLELEEKNAALSRMNENITDMLGSVIENRDPDSGYHVQRVKQFTRILVEEVMRSLPEYGITPQKAQLIAAASSLHDVGKISISDTILLKPGRLTDEERAIMQTHCVKGCEILKQTSGNWTEDYLNIGMEICLNHHEKWDGRGYPNGLKGDEIPISAQIVSIADIYDALTNRRCYKPPYPSEEAFRMIMEGECGCFSEKLLECVRRVRPKFEACAEASNRM